MPIYELDTGRPTVLRPMRPAAGTFDADSAALVAEHLVSLLGEPLFPVAVRTSGADSPHLLAVDAAGQPVVVEVVQVLDGAALTRSLKYAGTAARMSSTDLARAYRSGPEEFAADLVAFREGVPVASAHAAARHGGARLFVLCSEVAENVVDAVEFLRGPGRPIEVLQLGVVRGSDGRRYAEVSPLVANVPSRRAVEPSTLRVLPPTGVPPVLPHDGDPDDATAGPAREQVVGALAPTGTFPSVLPVPVGPFGDAAAASEPDDATGVAEPGTEVVGVADETAVDPEPEPGPVDPEPGPVVVVDAGSEDAAATDLPREADVADPTGIPRPRPGPDGRTSLNGVPSPRSAPDPLPTLVSLVDRLGGATPLVWRRLRRGQRFVLTLRGDGLLQLPDGTVLADPDDAATTVAAAESPVDGWRAWHVGDDGPALVDAVEG